MSTINIPMLSRRSKKSLNYRHLLSDLALGLTPIGSNNPYLEQISMVLNMLEPLKFDCSRKCRMLKTRFAGKYAER